MIGMGYIWTIWMWVNMLFTSIQEETSLKITSKETDTNGTLGIATWCQNYHSSERRNQ